MSMETFESPLGKLYFDVSSKGLAALSFRKPVKDKVHPDLNSKLASKVKRALTNYFEGDLDALASIPLDLAGTEFQRKVWKAAQRIPAGKPTSYGQLAQKIGHDGASRAVGTALGKNPVVLAVPCHRVISSNGGLGGFTGGLTKKKFLLQHESTLH